MDVINLNFPFKNSDIGYYFDYNKDSVSALKSDILHILVTKKGSRFFNRDFGTNLHMFLFDPNDSVTLGDVKIEMNNSLEVLRPSATVKEIQAERTDNHTILIKILVYDNLDNENYPIIFDIKI